MTTNADSAIESHVPQSPSPPSQPGYSTLDAICLPVSATGFSIVFATLLSAVCLGGGVFGGGLYRQLLQTDNPYVAGYAVSVVVFACFAAASGLAWWFGSRRFAFLTAAGFLLSIATLMIAADAIHDFGEGDQMIGYWGIGVGSGGAFGLLAFTMRRRTPLVIGAILPFLIYGCFYLYAILHS